MAKKYIAKKYDGDDLYSWAIFYQEDVKFISSPVFNGQADPLYCGMERKQAQYKCKQMNADYDASKSK